MACGTAPDIEAIDRAVCIAAPAAGVRLIAVLILLRVSR